MASGPILVGKKCALRPLEPSDAVALRKWFSNPRVIATMSQSNVPRIQSAEAAIDTQAGSTTVYAWSIVLKPLGENQPIGQISLYDIVWEHSRSTLSVMIGQTGEWGKGIGTEAIQMVTAYAFDQLGLHSIRAEVMELNQGSRIALARSGFTETGYLPETYFTEGQRVGTTLLAITASAWFELVRQKTQWGVANFLPSREDFE